MKKQQVVEIQPQEKREWSGAIFMVIFGALVLVFFFCGFRIGVHRAAAKPVDKFWTINSLKFSTDGETYRAQFPNGSEIWDKNKETLLLVADSYVAGHNYAITNFIQTEPNAYVQIPPPVPDKVLYHGVISSTNEVWFPLRAEGNVSLLIK